MRIIAGRYRDRPLASPTDRRVRPTAEPVRGLLLDLLAADLPRARVLDLFAGTGALGLEAISRGAATADFVEFMPGSLSALKRNITVLHLRERTRVFKRDAVAFAERLGAGAYDVAFADPPYGSRILDRVIRHWLATGFAGVLAVEHAVTHELPPGRLTRRLDATCVTLYRR